jgi:hypothetical protein
MTLRSHRRLAAAALADVRHQRATLVRRTAPLRRWARAHREALIVGGGMATGFAASRMAGLRAPRSIGLLADIVLMVLRAPLAGWFADVAGGRNRVRRA